MQPQPRHCGPETVIRQLPISLWTNLKFVLDPDDNWIKLASVIRARDGSIKFTNDDILNLKLQFKYGRSPTEMLLQTWAMDNVNAAALRDALIEAQLIRAANIVKRHLGEEEIKSAPVTGLPGDIQRFPYDTLELSTGGFNPTPFREGGNLIGSGGFGQVFIGEGSSGKIAVKRLVKNNQLSDDARQLHSSELTQQFKKEIEILARFQHHNILQLIGFSDDGPHYCIVTMYMKNGSLEDRLACLDDTAPLTVTQRIDIAVDTVRAINYLHSYEEDPIIHRDVKTANILLDDDFTAKLADCALARPGPTNHSMTYTTTVIGTTVYMPPEYKQYSVISTKIDSYSYGVVLLEILTGLSSLDDQREEHGLPEHISEEVDEPDDILSFLDRSATDWPDGVAVAIYKLAKRCLDSRKRRPEISQICSEMETYQAACAPDSHQTA